jgi:3-oxoacyl-[acyl-carrier-protein] synthase II
VSSVGNGKDAFWKSLTEGRSGVSYITRFDTSKLPVHHAGEVKNFDAADYMDEIRLQIHGRYVQFAFAASQMALKDAGIGPNLFDKSRLAMFGGTTAPSADSIEKHLSTAIKDDPFNAPPYAFASITVHGAVGEAAQSVNVFDSATTISTHCTSGLNAIGAGLQEIRTGRRDIVVAGSTESTLSYYTFISYILAGLLVYDDGMPPEKIMRPFDKNRRGGVVSEGAAFVVLEELKHAQARGAHIYGEVVGHGYKDKFSGPKSTKNTMMNAMKAALSDARMPPTEVDYVLANGSSTVLQDMMETRALKEVFGRQAYRLPISAIKSMIGIPNSAIGPMQLIAALMSFETDIIPPTINYETPDPECDLDYVPNNARFNRVNAALINVHGLDGACAALIAKRYRNTDTRLK